MTEEDWQLCVSIVILAEYDLGMPVAVDMSSEYTDSVGVAWSEEDTLLVPQHHHYSPCVGGYGGRFSCYLGISSSTSDMDGEKEGERE